MSRRRRKEALSFFVGALVGWSAAWWWLSVELAECAVDDTPEPPLLVSNRGGS